jgi:hypothetical protein
LILGLLEVYSVVSVFRVFGKDYEALIVGLIIIIALLCD